ncbi:hypothetical protein QX233_05980 [Chryseobacterium gambrini]|uniref:Rad50/SbcC-type AAA domain-containing protein n=1 Tax=Chryseobacterium gambrini TaxID=373672 RepID=A0AAJ1R447_9FLAO|nr:MULTISPECIES: hypothetical protein [Chryseobacterium]MDN4011997.1 hypothetical protein [Chryseobacterium gambrini]QWA36947.1 hypothetical protein KKI44_13485 [Chryseobacterium sp. ZHDP1]
MKRLVFEEIQILSHRERKAIKIQFNPKKTIIKGANQVGKSSLIKSIYYTLGATPVKLNTNWTKAEPITYLKMKIDTLSISVLRYDKSRYVVVDENGTVVSHSFKSLSAYLNSLFDFNLFISNRNGEPENPPTPYLFLPFYIDQDKNWNDSWNAFNGLQQFSNWKKPLLDYHSGIRGNKYYETKTELDATKIELDETKNEIETLNKILRGIKEKLHNDDFSITVDDFSNEITELLAECELLKSEQNKLKQKLTDLYNHKSVIESRIAIVENSIKETQADYKFALNYVDESIDCPMCGAHYENNFNERFSIAEDQEKLEELLIELKNELLKVGENISKYDKSFIEKKIDFEKIEEALNSKKEEIKLADIIENEGKKKVNEIFKNEQNLVYQKIGNARTRYELLEKQLKDINKEGENKKHKVMLSYRSNLKKFLEELNIDTEKTNPTVFERMDAKMNEQGSNLPRALLAYYFSILKVMNSYSTSTFCPIVIDSPNQQEQDGENRKAIMNFIYNNQPENSQLILGLVDDIDTSLFDGDIVMLEDEKYSLLKEKYYKEVSDELSPIILDGVFNDLL